MNGPDPESIHLTQLIGTSVNNADNEFVGTVRDILVNSEGTIAAILLDTGGILGVGKKTVIVPFAMCSIIARGPTPGIVLSGLHAGEVLVASEYQVAGATAWDRVNSDASTLGHAALKTVGVLSDQAADKTAEFGQKAVAWAAAMAHKGAEKVKGRTHGQDDPPLTQQTVGSTPGSPGPDPHDPKPVPGPHNPNPTTPPPKPPSKSD